MFCLLHHWFYQSALVAMVVPPLIHTTSLIRLGVVLIPQELSHLYRDLKPEPMCELQEISYSARHITKLAQIHLNGFWLFRLQDGLQFSSCSLIAFGQLRKLTDLGTRQVRRCKKHSPMNRQVFTMPRGLVKLIWKRKNITQPCCTHSTVATLPDLSSYYELSLF